MSMHIQTGLATFLSVFILPATLCAESPKIVAHISPADSYPCGSTVISKPSCSALNIQGDVGVPYQVYVMAVGAEPGLQAAEFGIAYDPISGQGLDVQSWCSFADVYFGYGGTKGNWPASLSGAKFYWWRCPQNWPTEYPNFGSDVLICALSVYAHSDDVLYITESPQDSGLSLTVCLSVHLPVQETSTGRAGFGDRPGFNPCTGEGVWTEPPEYPPPPPPIGKSAPAALLHIGAAIDSPGGCDQGPTAPEEVVTSVPPDPEGTPRYVYLLGVPAGANDPEPAYGVTGVQLGIEYDASISPAVGLEVIDWQSCSDLEFPRDDWPGSGSGNTITWSIDNCQMRDLVVAGFFTVIVRGPSTMSVTPFPVTGLVKLATCRGAEVPVEQELLPVRLGCLSLGGGSRGPDSDGCNPLLESCLATPVPVESTTWGRLKQLYR